MFSVSQARWGAALPPPASDTSGLLAAGRRVALPTPLGETLGALPIDTSLGPEQHCPTLGRTMLLSFPVTCSAKEQPGLERYWSDPRSCSVSWSLTDCR